MFEYKTRTKTEDGCKFLSQDILLYDYSYTGDIEIGCEIKYNNYGFGFVLVEENENSSTDNNTYVFKISKDNQYQIINKDLSSQKTVKDEFIEPGSDFSIGETLSLTFRFISDSEVEIYRNYTEDQIIKKRRMITYSLPHQIRRYKVGYYSNSGNILKHAEISTESPSNWVSNVANGNGGRIHWIKNGFKIEDCIYDCEVESQINPLKKGKYYFDFKSPEKQNIKYYIYPSERHDTNEFREMSEIMKTKEDEKKNILNYEDGSFVLEKDQNINIKFKAKNCTITDICIKKYKEDSFVETDYEGIKREASYISFDLNKIKKIEMRARILASNNKKHHIFLRGSKTYNMSNMRLEIKKDYDFIYENDNVKIIEPKHDYPILDASNELIVLKNIDSEISRLVVTYINGDTIDIILQKTFKVTVSKDIKTPIIITDNKNTPYDLSSSYRKIITGQKHIDLFNKYVPVLLTKTILISNPEIIVFGINESEINKNSTDINTFAPRHDLISPNKYIVDFEYNKVTIDKDIRKQYKYIGIQYSICDDFNYEFTNWHRQIFRLKDNKPMYIERKICDVVGNVIVYGINKDTLFKPKMLFYTLSSKAINSIDCCAAVYDILTEQVYNISDTGRLSIDEAIKEKYSYIIIDYLKDKSYAINEREKYYEVDIATTDDRCKILYDYGENSINTYSKLNIASKKAGDFLVLKKKEGTI